MWCGLGIVVRLRADCNAIHAHAHNLCSARFRLGSKCHSVHNIEFIGSLGYKSNLAPPTTLHLLATPLHSSNVSHCYVSIIII